MLFLTANVTRPDSQVLLDSRHLKLAEIHHMQELPHLYTEIGLKNKVHNFPKSSLEESVQK